MQTKVRVGILGATGMVGQRFVTLLEGHPWFDVVVLAASSRSAAKEYKEAVSGRWHLAEDIPRSVQDMRVLSITDDIDQIVDMVDLVFCAIDLDKESIRQIENKYAERGVAVVSNNSAHRQTEDVPMIVPEVNAQHLDIIADQRAKRGWSTGCIVVKPNCSIQSYTMTLAALAAFEPRAVRVTSLQAVSGAGRSVEEWPEMQDNIIPLISGEEAKSEQEPLKILGAIRDGVIVPTAHPRISATCVRVPISDGHMAIVGIDFGKKPSREEILAAITDFNSTHNLQMQGLPSAPAQPIQVFEQEDRPQTKLDRDYEHGMGVSVGRLREGTLDDWQFVSLSHNTIRGAAGGAILIAELLVDKGYVDLGEN